MDPRSGFSSHVTSRRRTRAFPGPLHQPTKIVTSASSGNPVPSLSTTGSYSGGGTSQETWDQVHPAWHASRRNPKRFERLDIGGTFFSERKVLIPPEIVRLYGFRVGGYHEEFIGRLWPSNVVLNLGISIAQGKFPANTFSTGPSVSDLKSRGTTAISRTIPTDPSVSVAQTVGELKEGLPSIPGAALKRHNIKGIGDEYLNFQFGILPLISDFKGYQKTHAEAEKILNQWQRDSGRVVRRRYTFPDEISETTTTKSGAYPYGSGTSPNSALVRAGVLTTTTRVVRETWFTGSYMYHIPKYEEQWRNKAKEYDRLYGLRPNASTAWELMPWSWLIDWKTNAGDVVKNITALGRDGLVLTRGYIMCYTRTTTTYTWKGQVSTRAITVPPNTIPNTNVWKELETSSSVVTHDKMRLRANPYGIGFTGQDLSRSQLAILAALGISKGKHRIP